MWRNNCRSLWDRAGEAQSGSQPAIPVLHLFMGVSVIVIEHEVACSMRSVAASRSRYWGPITMRWRLIYFARTVPSTNLRHLPNFQLLRYQQTHFRMAHVEYRFSGTSQHAPYSCRVWDTAARLKIHLRWEVSSVWTAAPSASWLFHSALVGHFYSEGSGVRRNGSLLECPSTDRAAPPGIIPGRVGLDLC